MKLQAIMMDPSAAKDGAWCNYMADMEFRILRSNGPKMMECMHRLMEPHYANGVKNFEDLDEAEKERIEVRSLAEAVLVDWRGVEDDDGTPIPYSVEKAEEILRMPEAVALREWIGFQSLNFDTFRTKAVKEAAGN